MPAFRRSVKHAMVGASEINAMPDVSFTIAQRPYTLRCAPGQEARLQAAASDLAGRVEKLGGRSGGGDDRQLLVMAALELIDALNEAQGAGAEAAAATEEAAKLRAWAGSMADRLEALAMPAEALAGDDLAGSAKDA